MSNPYAGLIEELEEKAQYHRDKLGRLEMVIEVLSEDFEEKDEGAASAPHIPPPPPTLATSRVPYPTEAIRNLFDADPERQWHPKEVVEAMQSQMDRGELQAKKGRKPQDFTYSLLAELTKQGFLERIATADGRGRYYARAKPAETRQSEDNLGLLR